MSEQTFAGAFIVFFGGLILFVTFQRFCSGLRFLETYNEIMAIRLASGRSIYPDPEAYPVGTVYTPLYFMITSIFYFFFPPGYAYGRLVSVVSTFVTALFVYKTTYQIYHSKTTGLWASVLFLSTYSFMDKSYDQCFVDSLLMCFLTMSLYYFLRNTPKGDAYAILFCSFACFTKQTALFPCILILLSALSDKRKIIVYLPLIVSIIIAGVLFLITQGWVWSYCIVFPIGHGIQKDFPWEILYNTFFLQGLLWMGVFYSLSKGKQTRFHRYVGILLFTALFGLFKGGGSFQAVIVCEPVLCIAASVFISKRKYLLSFQLLLSLYNPFTTLYPYDTVRNADVKIKQLLSETPGDIWLPMETYLYHGTEKKEWDNFCALFGPTWSGYGVPVRLLDVLKKTQFSAIVIRKNSSGLFSLFHPDIQGYLQHNYHQDTTDDGLMIYRPKIDL